MTVTGDEPTIGLVGLGNAGRAMVLPLSGQFSTLLYDKDPTRSRDAAEAAGANARVAESLGQLAAQCGVILLSLPTPEASIAVARELASLDLADVFIVETSTVRPDDVEALRDILAPAGASLVDAAIVGGVQKLSEGKGVFLAGSTEANAGILAPVLSAMAEEIFWLGGRGKGMATKLVVNAVAHSVYVVLSEAGALAAAQDIPMSALRRLLARESGLARPLTHRFGERLQARDFEGGMSTANAAKDSRLALDIAAKIDVPLFAMPATHEVYELALREGLKDLDYASIATLWEKWLDIDLNRDIEQPTD